MYENNNAKIMSPLNLYMESASTISNPGRITQPGGVDFSLPNTSSLTLNSTLSIRQQMDESIHEMVNILTQ